MADELTTATQTVHESTIQAPRLSLESLRRKADAFGIRDRHRRRREWLDAIERLMNEIRGWLRQSDPDGLLDVESYDVMRTEGSLGSYDAPALKIHLGAVEVDVVPVSREVPFMAIKGASAAPTEFGGRIDITDGLRTYNVFRAIRDRSDQWQVRHEHNQFAYLDREKFELILQDLLS